MKGYAYILKDRNGKFYVGSSKSPQQRYKRHLSEFVYTTKRMSNPEMVLYQEFDSIKLARQIQIRLKKLKRKDYLEKIVKDGFIKMK